MKINEVEALVGITRKNIRFYEAEGLLSPRRNSQNGYRDYGETEVEVLRRIKLLRKLGLPLEEIRQMQHGAYTVGDGMRRHLVSLERERQNLEAAIRFCVTLHRGHRDHLPMCMWDMVNERLHKLSRLTEGTLRSYEEAHR